MIRKAELNYVFYALCKHTKSSNIKGFDDQGNNYDFSELDQVLYDRFKEKAEKIKPTKLEDNIYVGITNIEYVKLSSTRANVIKPDGDNMISLDKNWKNFDHLWVFNIEKANTRNKAIVVEVNKDLQTGRAEYGEKSDQGTANDTVVAFNPKNGVIILPPGSRLGIKNVLELFLALVNPAEYKFNAAFITDKNGLHKVKTMGRIDTINVRISNLATDKKYSGTLRTFSELKNKKMQLKLYSGDMASAEVANWLKKLFKMDKNKQIKTEKIVIDGYHDGESQTIDLITERMKAHDKVELDENGKITINALMESVVRVYMANKIKFDISNSNKGGKGV